MRLKLISPKKVSIDNHREQWDGDFTSFVSGIKKYTSAYLALPSLAALNPSDVEVVITDENIEEIDFDEKVDLVGITVPTFLAFRAYEIADEFRKRGVKVVLGGIHPSMLPQEAIWHADAVVIGEAENVWSGLINDFKQGCLKQFYEFPERPCLDNLPLPRWDLLKNDKYKFHVLQTTRGCPYDCEFCTVKSFLGKKYRCKSIENVIKEITTLLGIERKKIFFVDDNFAADRARAKEILKKIIPFKIVYYIQATINIAEDEELLELLAESGCQNVFIGFESIFSESIKQMNKNQTNNADYYLQNIEKIQSFGIAILGSFIFGYDFDDESVFEKTVNFINQSNLESVVFHILTPFPGTRLFQRLKNENRILNTDWSKYDATFVCFKPKLLSPETLQNGFIWANQQVYSYEQIFKRLKAIWQLWNKKQVRLQDRISPIISNLSGNDKAYSYPIVRHSDMFSQYSSLPIETNVLKV